MCVSSELGTAKHSLSVKTVFKDVLFEYHRTVVSFFEQLDQLEVCLPYSRLLAGIPILAVFQNLRWNSNKTSLGKAKPRNPK